MIDFHGFFQSSFGSLKIASVDCAINSTLIFCRIKLEKSFCLHLLLLPLFFLIVYGSMYEVQHLVLLFSIIYFNSMEEQSLCTAVAATSGQFIHCLWVPLVPVTASISESSVFLSITPTSIPHSNFLSLITTGVHRF